MAAVRESFARQTFMSTLGASLELALPGQVDVTVPYSVRHAQQNGFLHAGVLTSVADSACGYAALTLAPPGYDALAVEFKINLLSPATATRFRACARVLRAGRTITVCLAEVYAVENTSQELVATMLSTVILRPVSNVAAPPNR